MNRPLLYTGIFTMVMVLTFAWVTEVVTNLSGLGGVQAATEGVNPEAGEAIYWGKGKCSTCHSMGNRGSAIRGPNHENIFLTAAERIADNPDLGLTVPTDYLVQSIADPEAYVVEGFKAEMPFVYLPPIALQPDEIRAVITYLQTQGGEVDPGAIDLPNVILEAAASGGGEQQPFSAYLEGDPLVGESLFFDSDFPACSQCHTFDGQGGEVGPELTEEAGVRTLQYIIESILLPSEKIASGYEPVLVLTKDGERINGVLRNEDDTSITLVTREGEEITIAKSNIDRRDDDQPSIMPDNFGELLSVDQLHDILAFLQSRQQE
ncbi:MAG: c-type cytochrome [Chloroflexi bacterium]|nr:c-type cytochrome [Chloroflexota bacterium]